MKVCGHMERKIGLIRRVLDKVNRRHRRQKSEVMFPLSLLPECNPKLDKPSKSVEELLRMLDLN